MSHLNPGLISAYNSLTDKHLAGYFSNTRIRRHLQRAGLITRSGRIVPDKEYRHKLLQRAHQRHIRECLAQAIFHKVLEMERVHQVEIKRRLEEFARRERVHKIKVERSKRYEEDVIRILSPRPPTGARCIRKQHSGPEGEHSESSESLSSSRPNTAPGKMQRPVRLKPIHSNSTTASLRRSSPYRLLESTNENSQQFNGTMDKGSRRRLTTMEASHGISPYCLPVINNFVAPVPPATKRRERGTKVTPSSTLRGRRLRPTTASSGADVSEDLPMLRSSVHQSRVSVNMMYFGKTVRLSHDFTDMRDEVKVFQQHCGGENLCVYKGLLHEGETFKFISRRHRGFPFSLTFFLNGLQVERLSSCCEFKHRKGSRLGGRHGHFGVSSVEGASPCYKCIIAMGLDKKPTPPPKRVKEDGGREQSVISPKDAPEKKAERTEEEAASHSERETSQPHDMETHSREKTAAVEDKVRDDYEEDFEADDEGPVEDAEAKEEKSPSPSSETQRQVKERDASETEDDEEDDIKSRSGSSSSGSDREESDVEAAKDTREDEKAEEPEKDQEETVVPPDKQDEADAESESAVAKDSDIQNSAGDSTEIDVSDSSVPSGSENKPSDDPSGDKEAVKTVDESKQEEEQDRAKSVQEKLAEAILKESQCSSEPELSDTSTEEEESTVKGCGQDNKGAAPEGSVTFTEQQKTLAEEIKCKEGVGEAEVVVQDQEETSDSKEKENENEQVPQQNSESTQDEKVKADEEDEKAASKENTEENNKSEVREDTCLHPASEEGMVEGDKTSELQEDAGAKSTDAAEKDEEKEKTAADADETGHGAKSSEEDESLVSEPNKKSDETALPDNAEGEAMTASETMEMKAEPSEEREALNCEEAPVSATETRQQGDRAAESEKENTGESLSSPLEGSEDTTVEKAAETREDDVKDDMNKEDFNEDVSAVEAKMEENQQERCELGEEQTEKSVEMDDKLEEKSEGEVKEEEKQTNPDEKTEGDTNEEGKPGDKDETEEETNESKREEKVKYEENISELTKTDSNTEQKADELMEQTHSEEDTVAVGDNADESEKKEKDDMEDPEEKAAATDGTNEAEANTAVAEENDEKVETAELEQNEQKTEQSEAATNKDDKESEEKKTVSGETVEAEDVSKIAEEPETSADADLDNKDNLKILEKNNVESQDAGDSEAVKEEHETITTEETLNGLKAEVEKVGKEAERGGDCHENREIDAENGEISTVTENKTHKDGDKNVGEAQPEGKNGVKTGEHTDDEIKPEGTTEDESIKVKEIIVKSGDDSEKHEDDKADQAPDADVLESEAKDGDDRAEEQDETPKNDSEPETSGTEIKAESKSDNRTDGEDTRQDENANLSDPAPENRGSDLIKKNNDVQSQFGEVIVASSDNQKTFSVLTAVDLHDTSHTLGESTELSDSKTDKNPHADENATAVDLSVENGDTGEASKASEEGASVLLKPQVQSALVAPNNEAENTEESAEVSKETTEALAREDNTDLVVNWVTMHQASRFFETFVEPLEDLKVSNSQESNSNKGERQSPEMQRSASPLETVNVSENAEQQQTAKDGNESSDKTKEGAVALELESNYSVDGCSREKERVKDALPAEETEVKGLLAKSESEQNSKESEREQNERAGSHQGSRGSLEEGRAQEGLIQDNTEQTEIFKTDVESIAGTHHSVTSGRPGSISENRTDEKTADNAPDWNEKQTAIDEIKNLLPSFETDVHQDSARPDGLSNLKASELKSTNKTWERSREVTEITDFTEDGSLEESQHKETQPKPSDGSINGDRRDMQLIQDIHHTLSKDRLSTFSVDETLFSRSPYPLLTAAGTESGH